MEYVDVVGVEPDTTTESEKFNLAEAAGKLPRGKAMKQVVGPFLDEHLRSVFNNPINMEEYKALPQTNQIGDISDVVEAGVTMLLKRQKDTDHGESQSLLQTQEAENIFFWKNINDLWVDSFRSGLYIPLVVAFDTMRLEGEDQDLMQPIAHNNPVDFDSILDVLSRPSTDRILSHLAKGPNGFIGLADFDTAVSPQFFNFYDPEFGHRKLSIERAYNIDAGKVTGLSNTYFLAAMYRRRIINGRYRREWMTRGNYHYTDTSGCPVRHSFTDKYGEAQQPIILSAKDFLARLLLTSSVKTTLAKNEDLLSEINDQNRAEADRQNANAQLYAARTAAALTYDISL